MQILFPALSVLISIFALSGCGDKPQPLQQKEAKGHVWQSQTDTIARAKAVEGVLQDATQRQKQVLDKIGE